MLDRSIGPLQDAQQAIRLVREKATSWSLDTDRVGVLGFSAGGHLAASAGTHFNTAYIPNPDHIDLRPNFMVLVYPVITMDLAKTDPGTRNALLGEHPAEERIRLFSNELQVSKDTPPALLLHAADDHLVDVDNTIEFFEAMRHHEVAVDMRIFRSGDHGLLPLVRTRWQSLIPEWIEENGWLRPSR